MRESSFTLGEERALLVALIALLAGCNSHAYHTQAMAYVQEAQQVLRETQMCQKRPQPCASNELVKFEAGAFLGMGGVSIHVYDVDDPSVAALLVNRLTEKHKTMPDVPLRLRVYGSKHGEDKRLLVDKRLS